MPRTARQRPAPAHARRSLPESTAIVPEDAEAAARIINAAVVTMAEHGYHGTSVRDIAEVADVSPAAIYHHFGSKHGLLALVMHRGNDKLYALAHQALLAAPNDPVERLVALVGVHVLSHMQAQREAFLGNTELRSLEPDARALVVAKRDQLQRLFDQVVSDGVAQGAFHTAFPKEASRAVVTMCSAVAGWFNPDGPLSMQDLTDRYQELSLALVGYRPEPRQVRGRTANC